MQLINLEPQFYRYNKVIRDITLAVGDPAIWKPEDPTKIETRTCYDSIPVQNVSEAQSIWFLCPICLETSHHMIECTLAGRNVEDACGSHNKKGNPTRWAVSGNNFSDLSLQPSILIEDGCKWHGFITNGNVQ